MKAFVTLHSGLEGLGGGLSEDEDNVILRALDMQTKKVEKAITPLDKVFVSSEDDVLDHPTIVIRSSAFGIGHGCRVVNILKAKTFDT